ncbi:cell filamentation protein [Rhodococcus sp. 27YEA15]|uniref:Fic/DOC family protein n=1 Tax=Rhodococcus sp. 27YEA15 TaxID=3156259 RepID=UPI003C7BF925
MSSTALEHVLAAERLEGWQPSDQQIDELGAVLGGTLSRREYFEQELARALAMSTRPRARTWWRRAAPYVYRGTSVLENSFGLRDPAALQSLEFAVSALRLGEAHLGRDHVPHTRDSAELLLLHQHVFQDLYRWSGHIRTVDIRKGTATFAPVSTIRGYLAAVDETISGFDWPSLDHGSTVFALAEIYAALNHAHPFREGNGRTGTLFLHRLTLDTAYRLDLSVVSRTDWVSASRDSAPFRATGTASPRPFMSVFTRALTPASTR